MLVFFDISFHLWCFVTEKDNLNQGKVQYIMVHEFK